GDWYYQIHSHVEYFPKPGEKISCVVEHASSHKPMIYHWDVEITEPSTGPSVFCGVGLALGLLGLATGAVFIAKGETWI
ncbi:hypothetical protein cypCar_00048686, partial [Cyprinus carpio]